MVDYVRRHIGLGKTPTENKRPPWQRLAMLVLGFLVVIILLHKFTPVFALLVLFLLINVILEQHKTVTGRAPVDIEILSVGVAYMAANHGLLWGFTLAIIGPVVSHSSIAYFGDATVMKLLGHVATAIAASIIGATSWQLLVAIMVGAAIQFCAFVFILGRSAVTNVLARLTTLAFSAYVIYFILPVFTG